MIFIRNTQRKNKKAGIKGLLDVVGKDYSNSFCFLNFQIFVVQIILNMHENTSFSFRQSATWKFQKFIIFNLKFGDGVQV